MLTNAPEIVHVADTAVGDLFLYPELGDGLLCIAACYHGQTGPATAAVALSNGSPAVTPLMVMSMDHLGGRAVLARGFRAEVEILTSTKYGQAAAFVAEGAIYVPVATDHPLSRKCLRLDDGVIVSSYPADSVGFGRWKIVAEDDSEHVLWSSDQIKQNEG